MFYYSAYSPLSHSQGYTPYLPRRSYFPASFDIDGAPSPPYPLQDLGYPSLSQSFPPPRIDAESRYRRALSELEAAEKEYQAHTISLEPARQAAAIRQRAAAEAARLEPEIALFAEIEPINCARPLEGQLEETLAQRQRGLRNQVAFGRAQYGRPGRVGAIYGVAERDPVLQGHPTRRHPDNETLSTGHLLGAFAGVDPERQRASPPQRPTPPTHPQPTTETSNICNLLGISAGVDPERQRTSPPGRPTVLTRPQGDTEPLIISDLSGLFAVVDRQRQGAPQRAPPPTPQPHHAVDPHTQPQPHEHGNAEANLGNILEFFHSIAAQARGAEQSTHGQTLSSQSEAVDRKGKAKAVPVREPTLSEPPFRVRVSGAHDQELRDLGYAIKLSLEDRNAGDVKRAHAFKASQSSAGARPSKVTVVVTSSSNRVACNATSPSVFAVILEPVSPLSSIRAIRTEFSALESGFKFPHILDFDHSELAVTSNNAPVRAYEYALNCLLERLDAIESDCNEEVRNVRREVVREVERALREVDRRIKEQAAQAPVREVAKQEAGDVESEGATASATQAVLPAVVRVTEAAKTAQPNAAPVASQADTDIDVAISAEYHPASCVATPSGVVVGERDSVAGAAPANGDADTEAVLASEEVLDSVATTAPTRVTPAVPVPSSSNKSASTPAAAAETILTLLSQDPFTFPSRPTFSQSSTNSGGSHEDDTIVVENSSEGGSVRSVDDE